MLASMPIVSFKEQSNEVYKLLYSYNSVDGEVLWIPSHYMYHLLFASMFVKFGTFDEFILLFINLILIEIRQTFFLKKESNKNLKCRFAYVQFRHNKTVKEFEENIYIY